MYRALIIIIAFISGVAVFAQDNCLFRNPLCFYSTDILTYLQVLHKNQQYERMSPFFYGPCISSSRKVFLDKLSNADFGYLLKRVGVKETGINHWSLTYERTKLGTKENFKIDCALINDTCRVYMDEKQWKKIFE